MTKEQVIDLISEVFDAEIKRCEDIMLSYNPPYTVGLSAVIVNMEDIRDEIISKVSKNADNGSGQNDRNVLR